MSDSQKQSETRRRRGFFFLPILLLGLSAVAPLGGEPTPLVRLQSQAAVAQDQPQLFFDADARAAASPDYSPVYVSSAAFADASRNAAAVPAPAPVHYASASPSRASAEAPAASQSGLGAAVDYAPAAFYSVSVMSTTLSAAQLATGVSAGLAIMTGMFLGLAAIGVAQAGYEYWRKYKGMS